MRFYMWVHVGHKFIHAEFHDSDDDRRADMAKKNNFFDFLGVLWVFFAKKWYLEFRQVPKILYEDAVDH